MAVRISGPPHGVSAHARSATAGRSCRRAGHPIRRGGVRKCPTTTAVHGCGGYAQVRSFVIAEIGTGHTLAMVTVWGVPFTMG
ncbi:MspA family porin [Nocardia aobensis]|uniref:MspA family porin n=1 Tax=Nocardia aobensis TaxID=257277 RepID=A0ABW6PC25_9NOCA